jgi:hypothetical protein
VKFNVDFNKVLPDVDKHDAFEQMILTNNANMLPDVLFSNASIYEGLQYLSAYIATRTILSPPPSKKK